MSTFLLLAHLKTEITFSAPSRSFHQLIHTFTVRWGIWAETVQRVLNVAIFWNKVSRKPPLRLSISLYGVFPSANFFEHKPFKKVDL